MAEHMLVARPIGQQYAAGVGGCMSVRVYRLVRSNPPTLDDFTSQKAKGIPMARPDPEIALLWDGVSVYATEVQARNQARAKPWLGAYIAEVTISEADPIAFRRTGSGRGHHTLWGNPVDLRTRVTRVVPV